MKKIKILLSLSLLIYFNGYSMKSDSAILEHLRYIKYVLDSLGVEEPIYVLAQAKYESGNFKCKDCSWKYNNMFGFKGQSGKYLKFDTQNDCLVYYSKWQKIRYPKYKSKHPNGTYIGFLKWCKYAVNPVYGQHIQKSHDWILKNLHNY